MATCDPLQPVVLLTDVMDLNIRGNETVLSQNSDHRAASSHLFPVEQTEPLNLCLNGSILNGFSMVEYFSSGDLSEHSDDDVVFVKEYKVNKRINGQKGSSKGTPRRNPVRKARVTKRFKEFTEDEFFDESAEDEETVDPTENFFPKNEDSEDWKIENVRRKCKQKRRIISRKLSHKLGRKRKISKIKVEEKKVALKDLEPLIESNLLLVKDYIYNLKLVNRLSSEGRKDLDSSSRNESVIDIFKHQILLLAATKKIDGDLSKYVNT